MSNMIEFKCFHCSHTIRTQARYIGMKGPCPHCGKTVTVEGTVDETQAWSELEPAAPPSSTEANTLLAGLGGGLVTVGLFLFLLLFREHWIGRILLERGPVQFVSMFVACWGMAILILKYRAVRRQINYAGLELDFVPLEAGVQINTRNVSKFLEHMERLPAKARQSIVGRRIHGALEHFRARNSVPEVHAFLNTQASLDASSVDSGYTLLRAFIWAIPLLGFIGTVTGISNAVSGLSDSLQTSVVDEVRVEDVLGNDPALTGLAEEDDESGRLGARMIAAMGGVTQGLSTAFDTTLVALVLAILLLFPTESLKRVEYGMLDRIELFTNETLLRRMADDAPSDKLSPDIARHLEPAFRRHQQWLVEWQQQLAKLGNVIGGDFERHIRAVQEALQRSEVQQATELSRLADSIAETIEGAGQLLERAQASTSDAAESFRTVWEREAELQEQLASNTDQMRQAAADWKSLTETLSQGVPFQQLRQATEVLEHSMNRLAHLFESDGRLAAASAPRPGLFARFRRR